MTMECRCKANVITFYHIKQKKASLSLTVVTVMLYNIKFMYFRLLEIVLLGGIVNGCHWDWNGDRPQNS